MVKHGTRDFVENVEQTTLQHLLKHSVRTFVVVRSLVETKPLFEPRHEPPIRETLDGESDGLPVRV